MGTLVALVAGLLFFTAGPSGAAPATYFQVDGPGTVSAGQAVDVRVRARDDSGAVDTGYRGTVRFSSSDPAPPCRRTTPSRSPTTGTSPSPA